VYNFSAVGDRFKISRSTAHKYVMEVVDALLRINHTEAIITWLDETRSLEIQRAFLESYRFPGKCHKHASHVLHEFHVCKYSIRFNV